jgi:hypothetical protein
MRLHWHSQPSLLDKPSCVHREEALDALPLKAADINPFNRREGS